MKARAMNAAGWVALGSGGRVLVQVIQLSVLTRLLTPDDFGLMAIVLVVVSIGTLFSDSGLSSAFLQRRMVSDEARSSLYWLNIILATAVAVLIALLAPVLSLVFEAPATTGVVLVCCPILVLGALGRQFEVASEKALRFRPLVLIELCATVIGFITAVSGALAGWHAYSLAAAALMTAASRAILAFTVLSHGWRPRKHLQWTEIRPYLGFGSATLASNLVNQLNASIDLMLGGRFLGMDSLGLYSVPRALVLNLQNAINPIVTRVGFPVIAQIQADRDAVRRAYQAVMNVVCVVGAPLYVAVAVLSKEICELLLGPNWLDSAAPLSLLAVWGYLRSQGNPVGALLLGVGRADVALHWNLALLAVYPIALWIGSWYGTTGLATSLLICAAALFVPGWRWLVFPHTGWSFWDYARTTLQPLAVAGACFGLAAWGVGTAESPLARILFVGAIGSGAYALVTGFTNPDISRLALHLTCIRTVPTDPSA